MTDEQAVFIVRGIIATASDKAGIQTCHYSISPSVRNGLFVLRALWINSESGNHQSMTFVVDDIKTKSHIYLVDQVAEAFGVIKHDIHKEVAL